MQEQVHDYCFTGTIPWVMGGEALSEDLRCCLLDAQEIMRLDLPNHLLQT